jgi:hypothetical protein
MQAVITHPAGIEVGLTSEAARAEIEVSAQELDRLILPSQRQSSQERLAVYANAYYARLLDCLREEFPVLAKTLGEEAFDAFAFGYLQAYSPRSYTLGELGRQFHQYLAETRPADDGFLEGSIGWPEFLIDLATLERCYGEVFDGPGIENRPSLQAADLLAIRPENWPDTRLVPAPCLRLLALRFPVHEYISAVRLRGEATIPEPAATHLVVTRRDYTIRRTAVSPLEFELLSAVLAEPVGAAIARVASDPRHAPDTLESSLRTWFQQWTSAGYFIGAGPATGIQHVPPG